MVKLLAHWDIENFDGNREALLGRLLVVRVGGARAGRTRAPSRKAGIYFGRSKVAGAIGTQ